jgi:hypothetical protein
MTAVRHDDYFRSTPLAVPRITPGLMRPSLAIPHYRAANAVPLPGTLVMVLGLLLANVPSLRAQIVPGEGAQIGSPAADRARLAQITGRAVAAEGRDSALGVARSARLRAVEPTVRIVWNSDIPFEGNDDALWAGRGTSVSVTGGASYSRAIRGRQLDVVLAPVVAHSQNRPFPTRPGRDPGRSAFSSPFYDGHTSADLPLRFGDAPVTTVGFGQSSATLTLDRVAVGVGTHNEWWGPAIRNTLLLGNNAPGVPRLFVRTARPHRTRIGEFDARAFVGTLTESPFFDADGSNDHRSLSALLVVFRPSIDSGLTLGVSRLVAAPVASLPAVLLHMLDALVRYEPVQAYADTTDDGRSRRGSDQLFSLFVRWAFPQSGFETYAEWARAEMPRSVRELLEAPQNTQAYTLGLQWADTRVSGQHLRLQGELTYLEQTAFLAGRPPTQDYYTGQAAVQGFTERGQVLGASIGPGASSQFLAADWLSTGWQAGVFVGRVRSENDALYREGGPRLTQHDVTVYSGVRGAVRFAKSDLHAALTVGRRYNYLLQSLFYLGSPPDAVDIDNVSLTFTVTPR